MPHPPNLLVNSHSGDALLGAGHHQSGGAAGGHGNIGPHGEMMDHAQYVYTSSNSESRMLFLYMTKLKFSLKVQNWILNCSVSSISSKGLWETKRWQFSKAFMKINWWHCFSWLFKNSANATFRNWRFTLHGIRYHFQIHFLICAMLQKWNRIHILKKIYHIYIFSIFHGAFCSKKWFRDEA